MSFPRSSFPLIRPGTTVKQTNQWINAKLMGKKIVSLILSLKFKNNKYKSYFDLPPRSREGSWALTVLLSGSRPISASISWNRPEKMFLMIFIICHRQMCGAKKNKPKTKKTKNKQKTKGDMATCCGCGWGSVSLAIYNVGEGGGVKKKIKKKTFF